MKKKNSAGNTVVTLVALCSDDCCCPTIEFTSEKLVTIKDDYGGVVFLTIPEWEMLQNIDYSTIINAVYNR